MTPFPLQAVLFDLDGTLFNCPYDFAAMREAVAALARRYGLSGDLFSGTGILEGIARGQSLLPGEPGRRFRAEAEREVLRLELEGARHSAPLDGAAQVLSWLNGRGIRVGIITRNSAAIVRPLLEKAGFHYDALLAREDVPRVKPHPDHIREMLGLLVVEPGAAVMAGDHVWDIVCARAAGLRSVGLTSGTSTREALLQAGADAVLERISDLPAWLAGSGGLGTAKSSI
jgi:phosphoglycolate phosphatase